MKCHERNEIMLKNASKNAQEAFDVVFDKDFSSVPEIEKVAWAMVAIIHCDICRIVVAFDECEGLAKLIWIIDIVSKLHDAKSWYYEKRGRLLRTIAENKDCGSNFIPCR